ncbi:hypothetical protein LTS10_010610 [Elasticomyces elasticus]|nr:hypothetical protein LTS10_010610 [Elasticomyces elasticus]
MTDTQHLYIPCDRRGSVAGKYVVSGFRRWNKAGKEEYEDFETPAANTDRMLDIDTYQLRECFNGHLGAITITLQRVKFQKRCGNYIIRRSDPNHDISTVPPECHRTAPRTTDGELRVINRNWVTPSQGEAGEPFVFEFMNTFPEAEERQLPGDAHPELPPCFPGTCGGP